MKKIQSLLLLAFVIISITACSPEKDITNPTLTEVLLLEDFSAGAIDNVLLTTAGWTNVAEIGTVRWKYQIFSNDAYAEFSSFQSTDPICVGWLISPKLDLDKGENERLFFEAGQSYVTSAANSLEVLIATNYDGTNLASANWQALPAVLPTFSSQYFAFIKSGIINLSGFSGKVNIGFRVKGSGTNIALDGSFKVDNVKVFYQQ